MQQKQKAKMCNDVKTDDEFCGAASSGNFPH